MTLADTISLCEAGRRRWGAIVVGAGPAGALTAGLVARLGVATLLVDRAAFPRAKVCGGCLNGRALATLARAGLGDLPWRQGGQGLASFRLSACGQDVRLPLPGGVAISRQALDAGLVSAAVERGASLLTGTEATLDGEGRVLLRQPGEAVNAVAGVVIAADGLGGHLLSRAGVTRSTPAAGSRIGAGVVIDWAEPFYAPGEVAMACGPDGYVGLTRVEGGRLDVACALDVDATRRLGPGRLAEAILGRAGWPVPPDLTALPWRGTPPLTRSSQRVAARRVFVVGDAAGYVEPFTGEGMAWALSSALRLAPLAARGAVQWHHELASRWEQIHRRLVTGRQGFCRLAAAALRRPWLVALGIALLRRAPAVARPILNFLNREA